MNHATGALGPSGRALAVGLLLASTFVVNHDETIMDFALPRLMTDPSGAVTGPWTTARQARRPAAARSPAAHRRARRRA